MLSPGGNRTSRLMVVGDSDQLRERIAALFGKLPRGNYNASAGSHLSFSASTVEVMQRGLPTNYIEGLFTAPTLTSPDINHMQLAAAMLRDRVFEEVARQTKPLVCAERFLEQSGANVGGIYVSAVEANTAIQVMLNEIRRLQVQPVHQLDISGVVSQYLTTYYMGQETNAAQAANLAEYELIGGGWRNSFDTIAHLL